MKPFQFEKTTSITEALDKKKGSAKLISGGTNLVDLMKKHIHEPDVLVDVTEALSSEITTSENGIRIGAMARNTAVATNKTILESYPLLSKAILKGASPQIRNMASTGGNLLQRTRCPYFYDTTLPCNKRKPGSGCGAKNGDNRMAAVVGYSDHCVAVHPSDMCIALIALDAKVEIQKKDSTTEKMAFKDFHRLPGDEPEKDNNLPENALITAIEIPKNTFNVSEYIKVRDRESYAFALISVAAALHISGDTINDIRLASGGVAHKPWRWTKAEDFLKGKAASVENFEKAAEMVASEVKPLQHNQFKAPMLKGAIVQALTNCISNS